MGYQPAIVSTELSVAAVSALSSCAVGTPAVFLDLNGTLVLPMKQESLAELRLIDGTERAIARLCEHGFICPVVTIQARIAKGLFSEPQFRQWFVTFAAGLSRSGARVLGPYVCPHRFTEPCACKKPNTVLYERAAREHAIDLRRSFTIGDSAEDVEAAHRFGGRGCLVRTGWAAARVDPEQPTPHAAHVADSLEDAVAWILDADPV